MLVPPGNHIFSYSKKFLVMSRRILVRPKISGLGGRIRKVRGNLTQKAFGEIIGVSVGAVSQYEAEIICPSESVLKKIADFGGVSLEWLLEGKEPPDRLAEPAPEFYEPRPRVLDSQALAQAIILARDYINRRRLTLSVDLEAAFISWIYDFRDSEKRWPDDTEMEKNLELLSSPQKTGGRP